MRIIDIAGGIKVEMALVLLLILIYTKQFRIAASEARASSND
jgi:hypothetical protein